MDMDNGHVHVQGSCTMSGMGTDCGNEEWGWVEVGNGGNWDDGNNINNKISFEKD